MKRNPGNVRLVNTSYHPLPGSSTERSWRGILGVFSIYGRLTSGIDETLLHPAIKQAGLRPGCGPHGHISWHIECGRLQVVRKR